jgi:hypothetical protein
MDLTVVYWLLYLLWGNYFEPQFLFSFYHPLGETDVCGLCVSQFQKSDSQWSDAVRSISTTSSIYFPYMFHLASEGSCCTLLSLTLLKL